MTRRAYGDGSLFVERGRLRAKTRDANGRQVNRTLGPADMPKAEAKRLLRAFLAEVAERPAAAADGLTVAEVCDRYLQHVEAVRGRKKSTVEGYGIIVRAHLSSLGNLPADKLTAEDVTRYMTAKLRTGLARQTVVNQLNLLHGVMQHAVKRGWVRQNVVALVDRPEQAKTDPEIRYLDDAEEAALLRAVPADELGGVEAVLYRTAMQAGLRQGELLGLRWRDVDWSAGVIRVRQAWVRGEFSSPKSRRSSRAVPMHDGLAAELERHWQANEKRAFYLGDDDLVFAHPQLGTVLDSSKLRRRFRAAVKAAGLRPIRFHDMRHTYGTRMAAAGTPMRALQEFMGHRSSQTTEIYADFQPDAGQGRGWAERAFGVRTNLRTNLADAGSIGEQVEGLG